MKFNVSISGAEEGNRGMGFNLLVDANHVVEAIEKGKEELLKTLNAAGLGPKQSSPSSEPDPKAAA